MVNDIIFKTCFKNCCVYSCGSCVHLTGVVMLAIVSCSLAFNGTLEVQVIV